MRTNKAAERPRGRWRPRIGVAGRDPTQLQNYLDAIEAAGGEAVPLLPGAGALVESYRTARGPRQRVVAYLGEVDEHGRMALPPGHGAYQQSLYEAREPAVGRGGSCSRARGADARVRRSLAWVHAAAALGSATLCWRRRCPPSRVEIPWPTMALVLVLGRLCAPGSELHLAEHFCDQSALPDLLAVPTVKVNEDRLYRALDQLLPHKVALEQHLKDRLGQLFAIQYDLLLYAVTSIYFEGEATRNPQAQRGYSRDHRLDCKQINLALVVTREGLPLGYEIFAGNRNDVTTLEEIIETMERRYGTADRIWVLDRGLVSEDHVAWLKAHHRRYIVGTPKSRLRRFERALAADTWQRVRKRRRGTVVCRAGWR